METINGEWYMKGCGRDDPSRIRTPEELAEVVGEMGFLPLFSNDVPGFSVEERTRADAWWTGDPATDPWEWRMLLAAREDTAYGKFFDRKAGFVSREWFPAFANHRRNGYDFDALYDDGLASRRAGKIMDVFGPVDEGPGEGILTFELKERAGFGKGGEKNFPGVLTELQMQTYLIMSDFRQRRSKRGEGYGWHIAAMSPPEAKWGYDFIAAGYAETPEASWDRIRRHITTFFPSEEGALRLVAGPRRPGQR